MYRPDPSSVVCLLHTTTLTVWLLNVNTNIYQMDKLSVF